MYGRFPLNRKGCSVNGKPDRWDDLYRGQTEYGGTVGGMAGPVYLVAALVSNGVNPTAPENSEWRIRQCPQEDDEADGFDAAELLQDSIYCEMHEHCHAILLIHVTLAFRDDHNRISVHWNVADIWTHNNLCIPGHGCVLRKQRRRLFKAIYDHFDDTITRLAEPINEPMPDETPELGGESG